MKPDFRGISVPAPVPPPKRRGPRADPTRTRSNHRNLLRSAHRDCDHVPEGFVLSSIWDFLKDGSNQAVLSWIGAGIVVVAGGFWAALKFFFRRDKNKSASPPSVHADHGGFAAGRDIRNNTIDKRSGSKR
jgi:hypothetical protein